MPKGTRIENFEFLIPAFGADEHASGKKGHKTAPCYRPKRFDLLRPPFQMARTLCLTPK
ncbi:hypothetical protein C4K27_2667 [Pseudomonas chlororaphis subsp. chlororaphis]|nr:hypothetical protein C4K27_2667 [Pseudomonas chlororaphis subsp. chlororaphis]